MVAYSALALVLYFAVVSGSDWGYEGEHGPVNWKDNYPTCGGVHQSPVDIITQSTVASNPGDLNFEGYDEAPEVGFALTNNGHTAQVNVPTDTMSVSGGPLGDMVYKLEQFHSHWGSRHNIGSEHTVNGKHYPAEMHAVHYNAKYASVSEAAGHSDGLFVLGIFIEIGENHNEKFAQYLQFITDVRKEGSTTDVLPFPIGDLFPSNVSDYYYYDGSLTTPGCNEVVIWTLLKEPIQISAEQIEQYRKLRAEKHHRLVNNFRPTQPLNDRRVKRSF